LNRVIERHPTTILMGLHVADRAENLDEVSAALRRYPNTHGEIAARISELSRPPRRSRGVFEEFQDRIMFGTDGGALFGPGIYSPYFRFLETMDEYFDYSPFAVPNQGRWRIYGIGLPDEILKKVYHNNAARMLEVSLARRIPPGRLAASQPGRPQETMLRSTRGV
jgi:predicted TIM-barrel fold metal-dependent hydrolase